MLTQSKHFVSTKSRVRVKISVRVRVSDNACCNIHLQTTELSNHRHTTLHMHCKALTQRPTKLCHPPVKKIKCYLTQAKVSGNREPTLSLKWVTILACTVLVYNQTAQANSACPSLVDE